MVDDEALVPAVEVFMGVDLDSELLQHGLVGTLAHRVHGGAHIIQDAHDAWRILDHKENSSHSSQTLKVTRKLPAWILYILKLTEY